MKTNPTDMAKRLKIAKARSLEATFKADLISAVLQAIERDNLTHAEIAERSRLPRSAVTGMLSGSLQHVTIDRILRLVEAVGLVPVVHVRRARRGDRPAA